MSKSTGKFFTVREISEKYDLQVLRFFMLSAHYRSPLNFSGELMEAAKNGLERIVNCVTNLDYLLKEYKSDGSAQMLDQERVKIGRAKVFTTKFEEAMDDDFNTADAISYIFELVKFANSNACGKSTPEFLAALKNQIILLSDVCGLIVEKEDEMLDQEIEALVLERQTARKEKNFARADEIRDLLLGKGITLEDTREGVKIVKK